MSMIRGKIEAIREVHPESTIVGDTDFVKENNRWIDTSNHGAQLKTESLVEAFVAIANKTVEPQET